LKAEEGLLMEELEVWMLKEKRRKRMEEEGGFMCSCPWLQLQLQTGAFLPVVFTDDDDQRHRP
jgi:hypothetical protein